MWRSYRSVPEDVGGEFWGHGRRFSIWRMKKVQNPMMIKNGVQDNSDVNQGLLLAGFTRDSHATVLEEPGQSIPKTDGFCVT